MKNILTILFLSATVVYGQNTMTLTKAEYQQLKQSGMLSPNVQYQISDAVVPTNIKYNGGNEKNAVCDCMVPLDSTFTLAMLPNDDESTGLINLPFTFDFYGTSFNSLYINNNGNISFDYPYFAFTPNAFPDSSTLMIAPFWADVDTRGTLDSLGVPTGNGGSVWYKLTPTALIVNWNQVGYFNYHNDLVSTFQLIISNGSDSLVSAGGNVSFCYEDMQWTTGDASGGWGGFGGAPATVGLNTGNGVNYFQVGQFIQSGADFDGPTGLPDGVDFLDGQEIYFNVSGASASNTPPLLVSSSICDTIDVYTGDTLVKALNSTDFNFGVMTPEIDQTIEISASSDIPNGAFTYSVTPVGTQYYDVAATFNATGMAPGFYHLDITVTDNGIPAGVTTKQFVFEVIYDASAQIDETTSAAFKMYPNPTEGMFTISVNDNLESPQVVVNDLSGKVLLTQTIEHQEQIDLSSLSGGVYIVSILVADQVIGVQRIIKE
ncbi:MAG: nidogen-like domain-containing protein [Flavobacteriia bacterium]|jgi:hypothetical protein|nr:T9SS type A sorting domain-containing protein [Cryomorphaceae bacterium]